MGGFSLGMGLGPIAHFRRASSAGGVLFYSEWQAQEAQSRHDSHLLVSELLT